MDQPALAKEHHCIAVKTKYLRAYRQKTGSPLCAPMLFKALRRPATVGMATPNTRKPSTCIQA